MGARIAVYFGTFDPVHSGHLLVVERGAELFDELIVMLAVNPRKPEAGRLFTIAERLDMLRAVTARWPNVRCESSEEEMTAFARARGATYLLRGHRGVEDSEAELRLAAHNAELAPEVVTVFVTGAVTSSSSLKERALAGEPVDGLCPPLVAERLAARLARGRPT
ncbi:MAG: Phosphopantetheine adenylyltransferase [Labilithrix sp.]|nr:Phosphopantetheine adenylyltransferase [Labilithrix sp.]